MPARDEVLAAGVVVLGPGGSRDVRQAGGRGRLVVGRRDGGAQYRVGGVGRGGQVLWQTDRRRLQVTVPAICEYTHIHTMWKLLEILLCSISKRSSGSI